MPGFGHATSLKPLSGRRKLSLGGLALAVLLAAIGSGLTYRAIGSSATVLSRILAFEGQHLAFAPAAAGGTPADQPSRSTMGFSKIVGHWMKHPGGSSIIVLRSGDVWSDSGKMQGRVIASSADGASFTFGDGHFFCSYKLTLQADSSAAWNLVASSPETACPSGEFDRPFASGRIE
jgi:hypothetical protein